MSQRNQFFDHIEAFPHCSHTIFAVGEDIQTIPALITNFFQRNRSGPWGLIFQFGLSTQLAVKQELIINVSNSYIDVNDF